MLRKDFFFQKKVNVLILNDWLQLKMPCTWKCSSGIFKGNIIHYFK